jgi:protocatechuate 3,4-dioxygenase beta subunit
VKPYLNDTPTVGGSAAAVRDTTTDRYELMINLSRRRMLELLGAAATLPFVGRVRAEPSAGLANASRPSIPLAPPSCQVRPEQMEGPYFVDEQLERVDIRSDPTDGSVSEGVRLDLSFQVSRVVEGACTALAGAVVDVWQCDARGVYSDVEDLSGLFDSRGRKFLRGHQVTDEYGVANFTTIYPGWYPGRAVHIHFKIRTDPDADGGHEFTSQLYFDEGTTNEVCTKEPYSARGLPSTRNAADAIFQRGGDMLTLHVKRTDTGYAGRFDIGLLMA